jgi:hypothetical protein
MPNKPKVDIRDPGQIDNGRPQQRKVYVSWVADDLEIASGWVRYLNQRMKAIKTDDADTQVTTVVPDLPEGENARLAGDLSETDLRESRKDVTDVLVVATSAYLIQQDEQSGEASKSGKPASDLLWFLELQESAPSHLPICWLAMLENLKLGRHRVGDINLGALNELHKLKDERFALLDENKARFIDDIGQAIDSIMGHSLSKCPTCNASNQLPNNRS